MELAPLMMDDPWSARVLRDRTGNAQMLRGVPSEIAVAMEKVDVLHHGEEQNFRPYLRLQGRVEEIEPDVELPFGIAKLPFQQGGGPRLNAFYEFNDGQLSDLVAKGYFSEDFRVPEQMEQIIWDLPGTADYLIKYPEYAHEVPVVFVGIHDQSTLQLTQASSDYDLHNYFPDYSRTEEQFEAAVQAEHAAEAEQYTGVMYDLFADEEFETSSVHHRVHQPSIPETEQQTMPQGAFERLVAQSEAEQEAFEEQVAAEAAEDPDSLLSQYQQKVAPKVSSALSAEAQEQLREALEETDIEFEIDSEPELGPAPVERGPVEQTRAEQYRKARAHAEAQASKTDDLFADEFGDDGLGG